MLHVVALIAESEAGKLWILIFLDFGLSQPGIEPESTVSVVHTLSSVNLVFDISLPWEKSAC